MFDALLYRHTVLSRPGIGRLVVSARRWRPNDVTVIRFIPESTGAVHEVPEAAWQQVVSAGSFEEVMAAIRAAQAKE